MLHPSAIIASIHSLCFLKVLDRETPRLHELIYLDGYRALLGRVPFKESAPRLGCRTNQNPHYLGVDIRYTFTR